MELKVDVVELARCANELRIAVAQYEDAVTEAKKAGDHLADQWKGAARDMFVEEQEKAYEWHTYIMQQALQCVEKLKQSVKQYHDVEKHVKQTIG